MSEPLYELFGGSVPVVVENDANALAVLATHETQGACDLVVIAVFDEGVGGGLVMDGRLRRGGNGMAMEIGHLTVGHAPGARLPGSGVGGHEPAGFAAFHPECPCGASGHLDAYATPQRICRALGVDTIERAANSPAVSSTGEPSEAQNVFTAAGSALGRGMSHVVNVVNPSRLFLYLPDEMDREHDAVAASGYLRGVRAEISNAYSTGGQDVDLTIRPLRHDEIAEYGARAAAMCVFESFIDHASGSDGCVPQRRIHRRTVAAA